MPASPGPRRSRGRSRPRRLLLPVAAAITLAAACSAGRASAQATIGSFEFDKNTKTTMSVESVFSDVPTQGFAPLRVVIRNGTDTDRTWQLRVRITDRWNTRSSFTSSFPLSAPPRAEAVHTVLAPAPATHSAGRYASLETRIEVSGGGFSPKNTSHYSESTDQWPAIALSEDLATRNLLALNKAMEDARSAGRIHTSNDRFGSQFRPAELPEDWRALSGLDLVLVTDREWLAMPAGARNATLEWTRFGGRLRIHTSDDSLTLDALGIPVPATPPPTPDPESGEPPPDDAPTGLRADRFLGAIEIHPVAAADGSLDHDAVIAEIETLRTTGGSSRRLSRLADDYDRNWGLHTALGNRSFAGWQVSIILVLFGILVGPINLFVFAPTGRRHRLFLTTPLIAVGTSLLLLALIFLQDGSGGQGRRIAFLEIRPDERKAFLVQEQVARTGVLLARTFTLSDPAAFLTPVRTRRSPWALVSDRGGRGELSYSLAGNTLGGDWFQSRSEQGHYAESVRPTRARVERIPDTDAAAEANDAPPTLLSSLEFPVEQLFYVDADGRHWTSPPGPVAAGQRVTLREIPGADMMTTVETALDPFSTALGNDLLDTVRSTRNAFTAVVPEREAANHFLSTLDTIDWTSNRLVVHGPVGGPSQRP